MSPDAAVHWYILGRIHLAQGRYDDARVAFERETHAESLRAGLALVLDAEGRRAEADETLEQMKSQSDVPAFDLATAYALRGDADQAFAWLEESRRHRDGNLCDIRLLPEFRKLHDDPRWERFLESMSLSDREIQAIGLEPFRIIPA